MRHGTQAMRDAGCACDGCRLTGILVSQNRSVGKVEAAGFRDVMQHAVAAGCTMAELARRSGVSRQEVSRIRNGHQEHIWQSTAAKLRDALLSMTPLISPEEVDA